MPALDDHLVISAFAPPPAQWHALEHERDRLRLLLEVSESIASHRDVAALFQDLAQRLPRIVPFGSGAVDARTGPRPSAARSQQRRGLALESR